MLGVACPRPVHYLAKTELYEHGTAFSWLIRALGTVPIRREGVAASAIRAALELLEAGGVVGVFPEGGIVTPGDLKRGVSLIAARADATIVPVHLAGTRGMYHPDAWLARARPVRVTFGEPFHARDVGDPADRAGYTEKLMAAIASHIVQEPGREARPRPEGERRTDDRRPVR
jgi:1-acyl-sn-glycerol-3-phosphate acyltransferase